tara:strand:+ start:1182 stop:3272 length:2091 start_codon:yes stop_codon:yes gene_type:complete
MTTEITPTGVKFENVNVEQPRPVVSVNGTTPDDLGDIAIAANAVGTYINQGHFGATDYMFKDSNWWGGEQVYNYSYGNSLTDISLVDALVKGSVINLTAPDTDYFYVSSIDPVGKFITLRRGVFYDRGNSNLTVEDSENGTFSGVSLTHVSSIAPQGSTNSWLKVVTNSNNSNKPSINQTIDGLDDLPMDLSHIPSSATHILFRVASSTTGNLIIYNRENFDTRPASAPLLEAEKVHQIDVESSGIQNSYGEFWVPNNSYFRFWLSGSGKFSLYPVAYSESPTVNTNGGVQDPLGFQQQIDDLKNTVDNLSLTPYINENHGLSLVYDDSDPLIIRMSETSDTLVSNGIDTLAVHFGYSNQFPDVTNSDYIYDLENQTPSTLPNWASGEYWVSSRHSGDSSGDVTNLFLDHDIAKNDVSVSGGSGYTFGPIGSGTTYTVSEFADFKTNHADKHKLVFYSQDGQFEILISDLIAINPSPSNYLFVHRDDDINTDSYHGIYFDGNNLRYVVWYSGNTSGSNNRYPPYRIDLHNTSGSSSKVQGVQGHEFLFSNNGISLSNPQVDGIEFSGSVISELTQNGNKIPHDIKLRFYIESGLSGSPQNSDIYEMNIVETDPSPIGTTRPYIRIGGFLARNTPFTTYNANVINFDWATIDSALETGCRVVPALVVSTGSLDGTTSQDIDIKIYSFQMSINFIHGS